MELETLIHLLSVLVATGGGVLGFVLTAKSKFKEVLAVLDGIQKTLSAMQTTDAVLGQRVATCEAEITLLRDRVHDMANIVTHLQLKDELRRAPTGETPKPG